MDINRNNYEAYFLDFAEGNLSHAEEETLQRFLKFNPDLSAELEAFGIHPLESNMDEFPNKNSLKKSFPKESDFDPGENFDMYCIACLEGDLTGKQETTFEKYILDNPERKSEFEIYKKVYFPIDDIPFLRKNKLKRKKPLVIKWKIVMPIAAAAAISLMIIIGPEEVLEPVEMAVTIEKENLENTVTSSFVEKKPTAKKIPSTLKVIKSSKSPVPVSDYKKENHQNDENEKREEKNDTKVQKETVRVAGLNLRNPNTSELISIYDKLVYIPVDPASISIRSFSAIDMAKYQFQKASSAIEEEDVFIWNLASNGLKELNKITGSKAQLLASKDDEGSISGIKFKSRFLNITTPIAKED